MGRIKYCWHVGIHVADIERSIAFYRDVLGFRLVVRRESTEPYAQKVCGYPGVKLQQAILTFPGDNDPPGTNVWFEIFEYQDVERKTIDPSPANPGTAHFCMVVDDLDSVYADLKAKGVQFVSDVVTQTGGVNKGGKVIYAMDPDGIRFELIQLVREPQILKQTA